jgi:hypothetical protein
VYKGGEKFSDGGKMSQYMDSLKVRATLKERAWAQLQYSMSLNTPLEYMNSLQVRATTKRQAWAQLQ